MIENIIEFRKDKVKIDGSRLKGLRKESGINQKKLSEKLGITFQGVSFIETKQKTLTIKKIKKIAELLDIPINKLYEMNVISQIPIFKPKVILGKPKIKKIKIEKEKLSQKIKILKEDIFKYDNISDYLHAWYRKNKTVYGNHFSYKYLMKKLEYKSKATLFKIINGRKLPSHILLNKIIYFMNLSNREAVYLILLLHSSKTKMYDEAKKKTLEQYKQILTPTK